MIRKQLLRAITMLLTAALLCTGGFAVHADDGIMPCNEIMTYRQLNFAITNGNAKLTCNFSADESAFSYAKFTLKIQKKTLGFIWTTVDIGEPNNERTYYLYDCHTNFTASYAINSTGTYRAVMKLEVVGYDGTTDSYESTQEYVYN